MWRWRALRLLSVLLPVLLATAYIVARRAERPARNPAEEIYLSALDALVEGDLAAYMERLSRTLETDPGYVRAWLDLNVTTTSGLRPPAFDARLRAIAQRIRDPALRKCVQERVEPGIRGEHSPLSGVRAILTDADLCNVLIDLELFDRRIPDSLQIKLIPAIEAHAGFDASIRVLDWLGSRRRWQELYDASERMLRGDVHTFLRAKALANQFSALHQLGRHEEAARVEREAIRLAQAGPWTAQIVGSVLMAHTYAVTVTSNPRLNPDSSHIAEMDALGRRLVWRWAQLSEGTRFQWYSSRGVELMDRGRLEQSLPYLDTSIAIAQRLADTVALAQVTMRRGRALVKLGRLAEAERTLLASYALPLSGHPSERFESAHNLLHLYEALDQPEKAESISKDYIAYAKATGRGPPQIIAYRDFGLFLLRRGRTAEAMQIFRQMIPTINKYGSEFLWAGEFFELTGQLDSASHYYAREWRHGIETLRALAGLTRIAEAQSDYEKAIEYATMHDHAHYANRNPEVVPLLPAALLHAGRQADAIRGYERALTEATRDGRVASRAEISTDLGRVLITVDPLRAAALADSGRSAAATLGLRDLELRAAGVRDLALVTGDPFGARARGAAQHLHQLQRAAEDRKLASLAAQLACFEGEAWSLLGRLDEALAAFRTADDLTSGIARSVAAEVSRAGYRAARIEISNRALDAIARSNRADRIELYTAWLARRKARTLIDAIAAGDAAPTARALQAAIDRDEAIIDFTVTDSVVTAFVLTRKTATLTRLATPAAVVRGEVARFSAPQLATVGSSMDVTRARFEAGAAHNLWRYLFEPLTAQLSGAHRVYLIPDADLHRVAYDALITRTGPAPRYMVDDFEIVIAPSFNGLTRRAQPVNLRSLLMVTAASAPAAELEARQIGSLLRGRSQRATSLPRDLTVHDVVHFAVHALPNEREPAYAQLQLDGASLYAGEIGSYSFDGKLVVLSACETANGRLLNGEGVLNLSRVFHTAGANATVATLWPVGAPTADFMRQFYHELLARGSTSAALRSAKLHFRHSSSYQSPQYWAPFTLVTRALEPAL